jgi:hypothetical protein
MVQLNCQAVREYNPQDGADQIEDGDELQAKRLIIRLSESDDEDADIKRLQSVVRFLKKNPGGDELRLIVGGEQVKFPNMTVAYSDELRQQLSSLVGDGGVVEVVGL